MKKLTHGELFAGIGGFGLGFDRAGMETKWHVEIDKACQSVLRTHWPNTPILSDVREVGAHNLPHVDVISFGSPCQDLSIAGQRKGIIDGKRSNLFFEGIRIVGELKPTLAIWENVPGAFSSNRGRDFAAVLCAFQGLGARDVAWRTLDAQHFGVPQRRRRIFLVADFGGERAAEILFESEGGARDYLPSRETGKDIAYALRSNPSHSGDKGDGGINTTLIPFQQDGRQQVREIGGGISAQVKPRGSQQTLLAPTLSSSGAGTSRAGAQGNELDFYVLAHGQTNAEVVKDGSPSLTTNREQPILMAWQQNQRDEVRLMGGDGNIAGALAHNAGMKQQNYVGVRRFTPVECERLQGFPDGFTDGQSDTARYRQLGNAVAVPVVEWIGRRIMLQFVKKSR